MLLLDEPSSSLDPRQRERLWAFVGGLARGGTAVVFTTHNVGEAERYADRVLVLADGELLFEGTPAALHEAVGERRVRLRGGVRGASCGSAGTSVRGVAFLLVKDLRILRRSPLLVALLVVYPVLIAVLIGLALSKGPDKPRVAILNELPRRGAERRRSAGTTVDPNDYASKLFESIDAGDRAQRAPRPSRRSRDGDVLARDRRAQGPHRAAAARRSRCRARAPKPTVEVLYNAEDPVKQQFVRVDDRRARRPTSTRRSRAS